jgi:hypothetical protein
MMQPNLLAKNTVKVGEKLGEAASQAVGAVTDNLWGNESTGIYPNSQRSNASHFMEPCLRLHSLIDIIFSVT